jgi:hypothetical protein
MIHIQDSILKCLHDHTFFNMIFDGILEAPLCPNFIMFRPKGEHLTYNLTNLLNL